MKFWLLLLVTLMATFMGAMSDDDVEVDVEVTEDEVVEEDAYDDYDEEDEESKVTTTYYFPDFPDKKLPVGKPVTVLVDFSNQGSEVLNISGVVAYLHSPFDLNYFIQNFTGKAISGGLVAPGAQLGLEYKFTPDEKLEALEFWLSGLVYYTVEGSDEPYRSVFVNTTVELFDDRSSLDVGSIFSTVLVLGGLGFVAYKLLDIGSTAGGKKIRKKLAPAKTVVDNSDNWEVKAYKPSDKSRRTGDRKKNSKK